MILFLAFKHNTTASQIIKSTLFDNLHLIKQPNVMKQNHIVGNIFLLRCDVSSYKLFTWHPKGDENLTLLSISSLLGLIEIP